tara:strand:+ start:62009 stop:63253 length:1245 start_codon:yes stop_codon:yes gene_type:complete
LIALNDREGSGVQKAGSGANSIRLGKSIILALGMFALAACGTSGPVPSGQGSAGMTRQVGPNLSLSFKDLNGWSADGQSAALAAFRRSCARILKLNPDAPLDTKTSAQANRAYGRAGDWAEACAAANHVAASDDAARIYFEAYFTPVYFGSATDNGLFTGYYEPEMDGALSQGGRYQTPVLAFPPEYAAMRAAGRPIPTRSQIEDAIVDGSLDARRLALVWLADPVDAFFLHVQGSGRVRLADGRVMRLAFAAKNQRDYTSIGKVLIEKGAIPRDEVSMQTIRAWLAAHPAEVSSILRRNDSYIFFNALNSDISLGPPGAEGVPLTPERSLAIDRSLHPLGSLFWLETTAPVPHRDNVRPFRQLMVAQDTGTAIRGDQRGDVFWGPGADAAEIAGRMKQPGRLIALLPRKLVRR